MRSLKFRAWISIEEWKGYFYPNTKPNDYIQFMLYQNGWGVVDCNDQWLDQEEFIIEQYTGLKDKNGVEIYEGDIIKLGDDTYDYGYDKGELVKVCWKRKTCGFKPFCNTHSDYDLINNKTCEIIGNIHENEDLLK